MQDIIDGHGDYRFWWEDICYIGYWTRGIETRETGKAKIRETEGCGYYCLNIG